MRLAALALCCSALVSCAPAAPGTAAPAGAAEQAGQPAAKPAAAPDWKADWDRTVAAARQEGKVVVAGPQSAGYRRAILDRWQKDFPEIQLEFASLGGDEIWVRLAREWQAEQFLWDVLMPGLGVAAYEAKNQGRLAPVRPLLVLPEVVDDSRWLGGLDGLFADNERQFAAGFLASATRTRYVNRDQIPESALPSARELVNPAFKGRIVYLGTGAGTQAINLFYAAYGEPFVVDLLTKQELVVSRTGRQAAEWVVRGRYPIAIGVTGVNMKEFQDQGLAANVKALDGPDYLSTASGTVLVPRTTPHPNAAKLYANWILSREPQEALARELAHNSRRLDVPLYNPEEQIDPTRLDSYYVLHLESAEAGRRRVEELLAQHLR